MDELIHHCVRELAFDGELGCDVSRLREFIQGFYARNSSTAAQKVDDAYCAYVWAVIAQQPTVRVGIVPRGGATEVFIAPQASAKRKAKTKGEEPPEELPAPEGLQIIPDAAIRPLEELRAEYGEGLRIAVDSDTVFAAITGSHIRPPKLTPMVYTALQFISRGRDEGISVIDLGKKSGYDQKTCFYLIKQLVDLDLVVKRRKPGVSTNICVHKYFFDRSEVWKQVLKEEAQAAELQQRGGPDESKQESDEEDVQDTTPSAVQFDPIDSRHLSSLPLVRARITKLLQNSPHGIHSSNNILVRIGFANPTKSDRRFFRTLIRELLDQGVIEKVQVMHPDKRRFPNRKTTCIRLVNPHEVPLAEDQIPAVPLKEIAEVGNPLKVDLTIYKQIINLLDESGTKGMTMNELSAALCNFDKRTIELLLTRLEHDPPPPHLGDLGIAQQAENYGRERRYKYYTVAHFHTIAARENFEDHQYKDVDLDQAGGFMQVKESAFYDDESALQRYLDNFKAIQDANASVADTAKKSKGKQKVYKNPILPDGTVKRGRPRKYPTSEDAATSKKASMKRKRTEESALEEHPEPSAGDIQTAETPPPKRKRGRPPKQRVEPAVATSTTLEGTISAGPSVSAHMAPPETVPKRRGRPPKQKAAPVVSADAGVDQTSSLQPEPVQRKRGRPRKSIPQPEPVTAEQPNDRTDEEPAPDAISVAVSDGDSPDGLSQMLVNADNSLDMSTAVDEPLISMDTSMAADESFTTHQTVPSDLSSASISASAAQLLRPLPRSCQPLQSANVPSPSIGTHVIAPEQHPIALQSDTEEADVVSDQARRPVTANIGPPLSAPVSASLGVPLPAGGSLDIPLSDVGGSAPPALAGIPIDPMLLDTHDQVTSLTDGVLHQDVSQDRSSSAASLHIAENNVSSQSNTAKRPNPGATTPAPSAKRAKTDSETENRYHSKVKLTQSRREKEFMRVITDAGGIVNVSSKGFYEAYSAVIEAITKAGEIASTLPGTRIDKRTVEATLNDLESRQKVKVITTSVKTSTGGHRSVRVAYLPDITESDLNTFLSNVRIQQFPTPAPIKSIEEPTVYGGKPSKLRSATTIAGSARDVLQGKNPAAMQQLVQSGDTAVREALLGEKGTLAQLYGYIPGKAARARELHLWTVKLFGSDASSPHIVSTEQRVVSFSLYLGELPISLYCALVSTLWQSDELLSLLASDEGRMTLIVKVAPLIRDGLQTARSRSRERLLELLYMLCCLRLVDPLQPTKSDNPAVRCARGETSPSAFDIVPVDSWSPTTAPVFWRFNTTVPLHLWALSDHSPPPFWKNVTVESPEQCIDYWRELQYVSIHTEHCKHIVVATVDESVHAKIGKTLKRSNSWIDRYVPSWYQTEYLRQHVDQSTGNTPLQDQENGAARIQHISWVVCAPTGVVEEFFTKAHRKHRKEQKKMQERAEQRIEEKKAREAKSKAILAQKAEEARLQRERDWDAMVSNVHPEPLKGSAAARVRRIRSQFLHRSAKNRKKWESLIAKAIEEANMAAKQVLSTNRLSPPRMTLGIVPLPPVVANASEKTVEEIISQQGPPLVPCIQEEKKSKKKGRGRKKDDLLPAEPSRRHRFQWNRDFDELARDAYVIIKARCRGRGRLEFTALQQAFPAVPRNSVRQRVVSLKEVPGAATYMQRLEDKWYEVWVQHRGTPNLPDADPESPTNFDLVAHIKFLRNHVDKNALRVGFLQMEKESTIMLPGTIDQLESSWNITEKPPIAPKWDFIWTGVAEEGREKQFVQQAFTTDANEIPPTQCQHSESVYVAEAALKMAMGTPNETYDAQAAAVFLSSVGEVAVQAASKDLLARGVFSKTIRDPTRSRPGRALKISDSNQNALGGSLSQDIFQDASALEDLLGQDEDNAWREWSLLSSDGDMAAMLELVSDNKIEFKIDTTHPQETRATVDWNSKKADDDDIETALLVRASIPLASSSPPQAAEDSVQEEQIQAVKSFREDQSDEHGRTASGEMAFCRFTSNSLIDCAACLHDSKVSVLQEAGEHEEISALLEELNSAGSVGISRERLLTKTGPLSTNEASAIIDRLINASIPLAYWAGYTKIILVAAAHIRPWAVCLSDTDGRSVMLFPRRWIDITGRRINDVWEAALRAVLGIIVFRPGIRQAEIRWRLRSVYDRWEVNDVLHHIREEGYAIRRIGEPLSVPDSWPADEEEERSAFWFLTDDKHWYHI